MATPPAPPTPPNQPQGTASSPSNAFDQDFLRRLDLRAEPEGAHEAAFAGPWEVRAIRYRRGPGYSHGHAVVRRWESPELGDPPFAVFVRRETALLAAAILPAVGRDAAFRLRSAEQLPQSSALGDTSARPSARPPGPPTAVAPATPAIIDDETDGTGEAAEPNETELDSDGGITPAPQRFVLMSGGDEAGFVRDFDEDFAAALHVAAALARSPDCLANLLEAAGFLALEQVGKILGRRIV